MAGIAAVGATVGAAAATASAVAGHGYWADGYHRLVVRAFWSWFDAIAAGAAAAAIAIAFALALLRVSAPRRRAVRAAIVATGVVVLARASRAADAWLASRGPNVLLVSIETLRADRLGAYGCDLPTSPAFDRRLAAEGVLFERCYSQSPKTTPSHMTMLTSLYPSVHGVEMWEESAPAGVLNPQVRTLAETFANAGYATAAFTGGGHVHRSRGFDHGFDIYKHGRELARALAWMADHRRRKFFVFFHTYQVHDPYVPPAPLVDRFAPDYHGPVRDAVDRLRGGVAGGWEGAHAAFWKSVDATSPRDVEFVARLYDAGIRQMDDTTLTALLDALDRLDLARDTLVVFTSDHGEAFAEHGGFLHDDLYGETLHVPLVMRFPGRLPAGARRAEPVRTIDVMPTILELVGLAGPRGMEGRSLVALARGGAGETPGVVSEYGSRRTGRRFVSLRRGSLTYIADDGREELYDTTNDPAEARDLAPAAPSVLATLRADLSRWRDDCGPLAARFAPKGPGVAPNVDTARQLRALGYVE